MTPNKSDSGELDKAIDEIIDRAEIEAASDEGVNHKVLRLGIRQLVTAHIQAVGEPFVEYEVTGFGISAHPLSSKGAVYVSEVVIERCFIDLKDAYGGEAEIKEAALKRQRLAQYLGAR
ncbi:hypothetical protein [Streptomyces sp. NPDC056401]|uniref:hypothetical protein n=1 Tax=Streptomyces sp. NPDC056401 TaxID=3345809 RepID=UPI0035D5C0D0